MCVESQICSVKQSLIGLHKEVKTSRNDDHQMIVCSTGQIFFSSMPDGVFNLLSSFTNLEEFGRLHCVIDSNRLSKAHLERNLRQYAHHTEPLFNRFPSIAAPRWTLLIRNIKRGGWELHFRDPRRSGNQTKGLSQGGNFI